MQLACTLFWHFSVLALRFFFFTSLDITSSSIAVRDNTCTHVSGCLWLDKQRHALTFSWPVKLTAQKHIEKYGIWLACARRCFNCTEKHERNAQSVNGPWLLHAQSAKSPSHDRFHIKGRDKNWLIWCYTSCLLTWDTACVWLHELYYRTGTTNQLINQQLIDWE